MKQIALLGSTGSIGTQTLDVAQKLGLGVVALSANRSIDLLEEQVRRFRPRLVAVADEKAAADLRIRLRDLEVEVLSGPDGVCACASAVEADIVVNAIVGIAGLRPSLAALEAGKPLALANKETMVTGGALVKAASRRSGAPILPVDSEHSAIFQCLNAAPPTPALHRLWLTASGGPFFGRTRDQLRDVTREQALNHPNWSMGAKITIDSATMMNKGLEVIEAVHLFDVTPDQIRIVVHRESLLHSAVEFADGSIIAQIGVHDMRVPIQYALTYPERAAAPCERLDLTQVGKMTFAEPDLDTFRCLAVCLDAARQGGCKPVAANGANEAAVALFLEGRIGFLRIAELVEAATAAQAAAPVTSLNDVFDADQAAREFVLSQV